MPDDLDPTTARLVSELAASILPTLTKSLSSAIPSAEFAGATERINRTAQDMRAEIVKAMRSGIDDSRAGRSVIMQSIGTVLEEIAGLRKAVDRVPEIVESAVNVAPPSVTAEVDTSNITAEIDGISQRLDALTEGIKAFFETYAEHHENNAPMPEIVRPAVDQETIAGLEGLIKAEGKSHSTELAEFTKDIAAMTEENNTAMIHEVREVVAEEISGIGGNYERPDTGNDKLLRIVAYLSGAGVFLLIVNIILLMLK